MLCAAAGLVIGSFLNVVIVRVPVGESVVRPVSRCFACAEPLASRDNVPIVSWLLLRGRARCCGVRIPVRYPLVEAGTAVFFALLAGWTGGPSWTLPALLYLVALLYLAALSVALAVIDINTSRLPVVLVAPAYPAAGALLGVASLARHDGTAAWRSVMGAAVLWGVYRLLHAIYPAGMGYGDVRLAGVLGLYLGWVGWANVAVGMFAGFIVGGLAGLAFVLSGRRKLRGSIPYGPYLLAGSWIGLLVGDPIAGWYLRAAGL
jgi:leader peptidase (prepilin peptidase)/N-methyltransferase